MVWYRLAILQVCNVGNNVHTVLFQNNEIYRVSLRHSWIKFDPFCLHQCCFPSTCKMDQIWFKQGVNYLLPASHWWFHVDKLELSPLHQRGNNLLVCHPSLWIWCAVLVYLVIKNVYYYKFYHYSVKFMAENIYKKLLWNLISYWM